jgi:predicted TIM-barrel fold metal-dependent hydrolase
MSLPFTNVHTHVFTGDCAPDRFLRILPNNFVRRFSKPIKNVLESKSGRTFIHGIAKLLSGKNSNKRREFDKYISFLDVGTQATQMEIFKMALEAGLAYDHAVRIVGLTMNMDYMDTVPSVKQLSFETQLAQVKDIKRYYPSHFFPFLGIDPRHKGGSELVQWSRPYFENGVVHKPSGKVYPYFSGIKLYPALGFFPFDPRLEELYAYAERNDLPVMTHCTRAGSQYIGSKLRTLIPLDPPFIDPGSNAVSLAAKQNIYQRIASYYKNNWINNSDIGDNDIGCDLFGHPENYIVLLEKFPKLKICLAHMGGSNEIALPPYSKDLQKIRKVDTTSWFDWIIQMMTTYPNMYTDISYTVSDLGDVSTKIYQRVVTLMNTLDKNGKPLSERVLFGTDFFMTEQEARESDLYAITKANLAPWYDQITRLNPQKYLMQPV